ncbi:hypothetical protein DRO42_08035 [Candidatus Bathyarchaeota archaeon]|nr:MAG: hypothetical protein DRO42_08035 [Candidatus Bathyarchaeota archaeon]
MTAKVSLSTHILLEIKADLADGFRDLQKILSRLSRYGCEIWDEHYRREPNRRGEWAYRSAVILCWVPRENYQPLATSLGKLDTVHAVSIKTIAYF